MGKERDIWLPSTRGLGKQHRAGNKAGLLTEGALCTALFEICLLLQRSAGWQSGRENSPVNGSRTVLCLHSLLGNKSGPLSHLFACTYSRDENMKGKNMQGQKNLRVDNIYGNTFEDTVSSFYSGRLPKSGVTVPAVNFFFAHALPVSFWVSA